MAKIISSNNTTNTVSPSQPPNLREKEVASRTTATTVAKVMEATMMEHTSGEVDAFAHSKKLMWASSNGIF